VVFLRETPRLAAQQQALEKHCIASSQM